MGLRVDSNGPREVTCGRGARGTETSTEVLESVCRGVVKTAQPSAPAVSNVKRIDKVEVLFAAVRIVENDSQIYHVALCRESLRR